MERAATTAATRTMVATRTTVATRTMEEDTETTKITVIRAVLEATKADMNGTRAVTRAVMKAVMEVKVVSVDLMKVAVTMEETLEATLGATMTPVEVTEDTKCYCRRADVEYMTLTD